MNSGNNSLLNQITYQEPNQGYNGNGYSPQHGYPPQQPYNAQPSYPSQPGNDNPPLYIPPPCNDPPYEQPGYNQPPPIGTASSNSRAPSYASNPTYCQPPNTLPPSTESVHVQQPIESQPQINQSYVIPVETPQIVEQDCNILNNALHGLGTDENAIINLVCSRNAAQRAEIRKKYSAFYGKDLIQRIKQDLSGNFEDTVVGLFMTPPEYDSYCLYKAMKGLGTNDAVLIEIIGTRNNQEMQMIKDEFQKNYGKSLETWVKGDTSGTFRKLLIALIQGNRSMNTVPDPQVCESDAQALYKAAEGRWGKDKSTFIRIFTQRSAAEMNLINDCYQKLRGKTLYQVIDKEFHGNTKKLLTTIFEGLQSRSTYYAWALRESVEGLGTNDSRLVRVVVSRCEVDMPKIKKEYQRIFNRDLVKDVRSDTSGNYRKILTNLLTRV
ncbi:MAG: hypothetical protein J6O41_07385 [Clostridia bacterium]|nr:hypothetical protein [Clostridia bacterium]